MHAQFSFAVATDVSVFAATFVAEPLLQLPRFVLAQLLEILVASIVHGLFAWILADALSCRLFPHGLPRL